jgi:hypothetical protein
MLQQLGGAEIASGHQNNIFVGTAVPEGAERHLYLACCGALLGPWACQGTR